MQKNKIEPEFNFSIYTNKALIDAMLKLMLETRKIIKSNVTSTNIIRKTCRDLFRYLPGDILDELEEQLKKLTESEVRKET